jgi:hypothetical protein
MGRKSTKKASNRSAGKRGAKDLTLRAARAIKGGGKRADGTGGGNVAGGWDLAANKVHS